MSDRSPRTPPRVAFGLVLFVAVADGGCKPRYDGVSDSDRTAMNQQQAVAALTGLGAKCQPKNYGLGNSWGVDLSGQNVTDDTLRQLKALGKVADLNLSKSTVTDAQIAAMYDQEVMVWLVRLDVSHTAITDASLDRLSAVKFLGALNVTGAKVTPAGVQRFRDARQKDGSLFKQAKNTKITGP